MKYLKHLMLEVLDMQAPLIDEEEMPLKTLCSNIKHLKSYNSTAL